ncbi:MAG TPA: PAS domain-containing sensor histidine kinase [Candidatus Latescibacteria bacterium]|nr:PAS domain-containing sensor histidine kinase [Candidatus Latescibacterota bacterium]
MEFWEKGIESTLRSLLESSTDTSIVAVDLDQRVRLWNRGAERVLGYSADEVLGRKLDFLYPEDEVASRKIEEIRRKMLKGETFSGEVREVRKDGKILRIYLTVTPLRDERGEVVGFLGIGHDLTERAELQEKILHAKRELQAMFDAIPDIIFMRDHDLRIIRANNAAFDYFGGRGILWTPCYRLRGFPSRCPDCPKDEAIRIKKAAPFEFEDPSRGRIFRVYQYPVLEPDGGLYAVIVLMQDVTEAKLMQEKQMELELRLIQESRLSAVGMLASGIAHNINNPLTSIMGRAQLLLMEHPEIEEELSPILHQAKQIEAIVRNLTYKTRQEQSRQKQRLDLNHLLRQELEFLKADLDFKHKVEKEYDFDEDLPSIWGVYSDFSQTILNIIRNALDAMYRSERKKLTVRTYRDEDHIYIEIGDTGCGIPDDVLPHIFEPFFTTKPLAGQAKGDEPTGTGLGLSTCRQILKEYGAEISVRSKLGEGTTFTVKVPIAPNIFPEE